MLPFTLTSKRAFCAIDTPNVIRSVGSENKTMDFGVGDVCFSYEPKHSCEHAAVDSSKIMWIADETCRPVRRVSANGDPFNKTEPFHPERAALTVFAKIFERDGFGKNSRVPPARERTVIVTGEQVVEPKNHYLSAKA